MIGRSPAFRIVDALIKKMSAFDAPVLIEGETGTGKELAARAIHYRGARSARPFVPVNCGGLPDTLIENEFFGHHRGAFTDARDDKPGLVELARGGTLFLDEVDTLTPRGQVTLLRFLQDQIFRPLGAQRERHADVRIIAASNRSLDRQVDVGEFRLDLFYRLRVLHLTLPPLRERHGDPELLAEYFVGKSAECYGKPPLPFDPLTLTWFDHYPWPGNIRELENLVHREFLLTDGERISIPAPRLTHSPQAGTNFALNYRQAKNRAIIEFESGFLASLMDRTNGNVSEAARISGTERRHLGRLLKKHGIPKHSSSGL